MPHSWSSLTHPEMPMPHPQGSFLAQHTDTLCKIFFEKFKLLTKFKGKALGTKTLNTDVSGQGYLDKV